jgi:uncharacterized protein
VLVAILIVALLTGALVGGTALLVRYDPDFALLLDAPGLVPAVLTAQCVVLAAGAWFGLRRRSRERASALGFRLVGKRWILLAAAGVAAILAGNAVAEAVLGDIADEDEADEIAGFLDGADPSDFLLILLIGAVLAPLGEEMFFRGILFAWAARRAGAVPAALATALLFALGHLPAGTLHAAGTFGAGLVLAALYRTSGSLWPAILAHALNNGLSLTLLWLAAE